MGERSEELTTLDIGYDRFQADLIVARCGADRIKVNFLPMDENGLAPGRIARTPHLLLVQQRHATAAQAVINQLQGVANPAEQPEPGRIARWVARLLGGRPEMAQKLQTKL